MRLPIVTLAIALTIPLAACYTSRITSRLEAYKGKPVDSLISKWGYPDQDKVVAGHHLIVWDSPDCQKSVEIDENKVIQHITVRGTGDLCEVATR